jgi:hypothetical protein
MHTYMHAYTHRQREEFSFELARSLKSRVSTDCKGFSEPLALLELYLRWVGAGQSPTASYDLGVVHRRMQAFRDMVCVCMCACMYVYICIHDSELRSRRGA